MYQLVLNKKMGYSLLDKQFVDTPTNGNVILLEGDLRFDKRGAVLYHPKFDKEVIIAHMDLNGRFTPNEKIVKSAVGNTSVLINQLRFIKRSLM